MLTEKVGWSMQKVLTEKGDGEGWVEHSVGADREGRVEHAESADREG